MTRKQKKLLGRILIAAALTVLLHFLPLTGPVKFVAYCLPYGIVGFELLKKALWGLGHGQLFDENFLMAVATLGAMALGTQTGDYGEAVAVLLFFQIGELFESIAVGKSRKNIAALMDIRPDHANIEENGALIAVDPEEVAVGTVILVRPGEKIPIDGIVVEGTSALDTAALTGESLPREAGPGDGVISGCISLTGLLKIRTTREFGESTVSKILDLVENAGSRKSKSEHFVGKFARYYTPAVCGAALLLALIPPIFDGNWWVWLYRALSFLVASCPCALVISIPLTFFAAIGGASRAGILVKGSNYLEALAKVDTVAFDKTGTLTRGVFSVTAVHSENTAILEYAALAESASTHPIAAGIREAWGGEPDRSRVTDIQEVGGHGVTARVDGKTVAVGNARLMESLGLKPRVPDAAGTLVHVALEGQYAGCLELQDVPKATAAAAMAELRDLGVKNTVMLTGDRQSAAAQIAEKLGISTVFSQLLPGEKVEKVEELLESGKKTAFVGDGINDAPVLARADVGIAMGALGSDAAIEAADIVLMDDDPRKIPRAIGIARRTMSIVYQNIVFSVGIKVLALILVALGAADMWVAIFADTGVMVLAVLNAIRAMFGKK